MEIQIHRRIHKKVVALWRKLSPEKDHPMWQKVLRSAAMFVIFGGMLFGTLLGLYIILLYLTLPRSVIRDIRKGDFNLTESTLIYDREGNLLYSIHGEENRKVLDSLDEISPNLIDATIAIEDDRFYHHIGIDGPAFVKAVLSEFGIGTPRGGSTITQQLVKNSWLTSEHSYKRKIQEVLISLQLELRTSKDQVLLRYLNTIPYGNNAYGVELAANRYFNKKASELSIGEAAILASIPKAPTRFSPYGNYKYSTIYLDLTPEALGDRKIRGEQDLEVEEWTRGLIGQTFTMPDGSTFYLKGRSDLVLDRMLELGKINDEEYQAAKTEIQNLEFTPYKELIQAPHFVLWVKQLLEEKYGSTVVEQGGLRVYTTLDPEFQKAAEKSIEDRWSTNLNSYGTGNAALVSVEPGTGQILAMVGSAGFFEDPESEKTVVDGQVNMITSYRQPGSSFKPFVYSLALLNQFTPATVLYDVPMSFGSWTPKNYEGGFRGPMSLREALGQSRNLPAIQAYFLAGTESAIVPYVKTFGFGSLNESGDYYGPTLALGTGLVTPLEMAEAYSVFANGGVHVETNPILKIETADGEILEEWKEEELKKEQVLNPEVAYLINDILSDPSVGLGPSVRIDSLDNAAKTGTSTKEKSTTDRTTLPSDGWIAAYTPSVATIVWTGNADGAPMGWNADGYMTAAPIWKNYMSSLLHRTSSTNWNRPAGIRDIAVSKATGKLPTEKTPSDMVKTEVFASFAVPTEVDDGFMTAKIETISNRLATEWSPPEVVEEKQFRVYKTVLPNVYPGWQTAVNAWAASNGEMVPPTETAADIHNETTAANLPQISITAPTHLSYIGGETRSLEVYIDVLGAGNGVKEVVYSVDGRKQDVESESPYTGVIRIPVGLSSGSLIELVATVIDVYGYRTQSTISLRAGDPEETSTPETPEKNSPGIFGSPSDWVDPKEVLNSMGAPKFKLFSRPTKARPQRGALLL